MIFCNPEEQLPFKRVFRAALLAQFNTLEVSVHSIINPPNRNTHFHVFT